MKSLCASAHKLLLALLLGATFLTLSASPRQAHAQGIEEIEALLEAGKLKRAEEATTRFAAQNPADPRLGYLRAMQHFYGGDYSAALVEMDQAIAKSRPPSHWLQTREIIAATGEVTRGYEAHQSPRGRFTVYIEPGRDRVLLPYALDALDRAYEEIGKELNVYPETPIRVEIYPATATLAKVSTLSDEEIRTSGTIALCKYNRLMITSPKALMRGYGWVDTLAHEYVHYAIQSKTGHGVPIWMHEGLAKYLERRWRGPDAAQLSPSSEQLLSKRLKANTLITFEQMHPSMAKLPSQEDAAVAFAEVYTVMEYLRRERGEGAFAELLDYIIAGRDAKDAFGLTFGTSFSVFERQWRAYLRARPVRQINEENLYEERLRFEDEGSADVSDLKQIPKPKARDHVHLGELLMARKRYVAAAAELRKAVTLMGDTHPIVQTRLAQSLLESGKPQEAYDALLTVRELYPSYVMTWHLMGRAASELKRDEEARELLLEAMRVNPFDPAIHEDLAAVLARLGDTRGAERERELAELVR